MTRHLVLVLLIVLAGPAAAQEEFPLVPGPSLSPGADVLATVPLGDETLEAAYAAELAARHGAVAIAAWPLRSLGELCVVLEARDGDAEALGRRVAADPEVISAEPIREYAVTARSYADDLLPIQDAVHAMNVLAAHALGTGAGVRVAVIDTGVATSHPDLAGRDVAYADFVRASPEGEVAEEHGTAMAALIGADAGNGHGMVGIAPEAAILALRGCWEDGEGGRCNSFTLARALNVALLREADVINLSLAGPPDALLRRLVERAVSDGRIVVAAAGAEAFPASVPGVIAAGPGDGAVPAPDRDVISAAPGGRYDFFSGASVATAHVSGVVALMRGLGHAPDASAARDRLAAARGEDGLDACAAAAGEGARCP